MPTVIALDVSLSMSRFVSTSDEEITYHQLAVAGINHFLDYLAENSKLEQVCLVCYSNVAEVVIEFTKNYDTIREALSKIEQHNNTNFEELLRHVNGIITSCWGNQNHCEIIVVSDCGLGLGPSSVRHLVNNLQMRPRPRSSELLPFQFPCNVNLMCLGTPKDPIFVNATSQYQQLFDLSKQKNKIFIIGGGAGGVGSKNNNNNEEIVLNKGTSDQMFKNMAEKIYKPFEALLKCGAYSKLESTVSIWPPPLPYHARDIFGIETTCFLSRKIEICGYINLSDIGSPMTVSRHLILPRPNSPETMKNDFEKLENDIKNFYSKPDADAEEAGSSAALEANKENVCVLLHGALKIENVAALALLNDTNWYGLIFSHADSKKKSNLMLTILPPGHDAVPWLGDLRYLCQSLDDALPGEAMTFPVKSTEKRSYSQNIVVWIRRSGLQSDIQKVLRHAKKLPEKITHFYKELNRIKRAALSLGFVELLDGVATIFEREISSLPANASPDSAIQLKHAATELRKMANQDFKAMIVALPTKYNQI